MDGRRPLSGTRIIEAAVTVADRGGLAAVSMRHVGAELGVEAMSLYHHVANKEALLDALADWIFARIELPEAGQPWRTGMVGRASSARQVLAAHPWALGLIESRTVPGHALLRHHDAVIGCLRGGGFPVVLASHAFSVIDAYVYGFVLTEQNLPFDASAPAGAEDYASDVATLLADYPHLAELVGEIAGGYIFAAEFGFGLDIILDELQRRLEAATASGS
ncbi:MAG TPA: TetR/AcrR family transcriptional regulator [Propionicimonas sp.]|jgi:AcrR family transcriptional regulator|nr:TetR/AcrR family transcriptional regulator [Propionicimonas sp.]